MPPIASGTVFSPGYLEREVQEIAAILECTDRQFLPPAIVEKMEAEGGRGKLQAKLTALKQIVKEA